MRCLVTAGNTREKIDEVRDWGNVFTGNTGLAIAKALAEIASVDLVTSNAGHREEIAINQNRWQRIAAHAFTSHADLKSVLAGLMFKNVYDAVFMTAAVADYKPTRVYSIIAREPDLSKPRQERWIVQDVQQAKVKSTHERIAVVGEPTEKLVDLFRTSWAHRGLLVKFKLEVGIGSEELLKIAERSRLASGADYLVANTLEMVQGEGAGAYLLGAAGHRWVPRVELPGAMAGLLQ
ncbi:MAG TPA: phosphopantothenoylcysteine decarboxylase [Tepidisphaeraceae bacterium]|jgi:phosphopantothenoylcysteine synthetase/decarboxylase